MREKWPICETWPLCETPVIRNKEFRVSDNGFRYVRHYCTLKIDTLCSKTQTNEAVNLPYTVI